MTKPENSTRRRSKDGSHCKTGTDSPYKRGQLGEQVKSDKVHCLCLHREGGRSAKEGRELLHETDYEVMKRITTFAAFAAFAFLVGSSSAIAEQSNGTGPVRLKAPGGRRRLQ